MTNNGAAPVTGNVMSYGSSYMWNKAAGYTTFELSTTGQTCVSVSITELHTSSTFSALTFDNRPQVHSVNVTFVVFLISMYRVNVKFLISPHRLSHLHVS